MARSLALASLVLSLAACGGDEPDPIPEACQHMASGSSIGVSNGGTVAADHRRYDLALAPGRNPSAAVVFNAPAPGRWFIYVNKDVAVFARLNGLEIGTIATVTGRAAGACSALGRRTEMQLDAAAYELVFAETFESQLSLVIEPRANVP